MGTAVLGTVLLVATLDTKGGEVAYLRDRLNALGVGTIVADSGILGEPVGIEPDIDHATLARRAGLSLERLQNAGTRGRSVEIMRSALRGLATELHDAGRIQGGISVGGVGSVMGAAAIQMLPVGAPKIVIAPTASGQHVFGPYVGTKDVLVMHSVVDILGLNPIATTVFDNAAAAMAGMLASGHPLPPPAPDRTFVAATMLGNTTAAITALSDHLAESGVETVVFHANGVGGAAMEELAAEGQFRGVVDYTTDEVNHAILGGIHWGGPDRLAAVGRLGLPQVVVPGCIDFAVFAPESIPEHYRDRPIYDHNPEYHLVQATPGEKERIAALFARRLNEARGPVRVIVPLGGLSIPNTPGGLFWDPEGDERFRTVLRRELRTDIPVELAEGHVNDPDLGRHAADVLTQILDKEHAR